MQKRMFFLLIPVLVLAFGMMPVAGSAAEKKPKPSLEALVDFFDTIVFRTEFKTGKPSTMIKKWTGPLRIALRAFKEVTETNKIGEEVLHLQQVKVRKPHFRFIKKHLNNLVRATGLKTEDAKKTGKSPNFMINFVPRSQMANPYLARANPKLLKKLAAQGGCYFLMWDDGATGTITRAVIVVNAERLLIRINHCLLEEMTQSLGLPNDSNKLSPTIFSDRSRRTDLTRTDQILLRTLYDPRMKAGLPHGQALKLARIIIGELDAALP